MPKHPHNTDISAAQRTLGAAPFALFEGCVFCFFNFRLSPLDPVPAAQFYEYYFRIITN